MISKRFRVECNNCRATLETDSKIELLSLMAHRKWVRTCLRDFDLCPECAQKIQFKETVFIINNEEVPISKWMFGECKDQTI